MCTFKICNFAVNSADHDIQLQLGGPTSTNTVEIDDIIVTHNLLSITGEVTVQPIKVGQKYFMLLGEIYNYDTNLPSDIYFGIEKYLEHGDNFTKYLDGEFLFIVIDTTSLIIDFFSDPWGTKQVFYYHNDNDFCFSTLPITEPQSSAQFRFLHYSQYNDPQFVKYTNEKEPGWVKHNYRLKSNSHYQFDVKNKKLSLINPSLHVWNLIQYKNNFDDLNTAFENAILKRYTNRSVLFLSGGVDSCCIAACLTDHKKSFNSITLQLDDFEDETALASILNYTQEFNTNHIIRNVENASDDDTTIRELLIKRNCVDPESLSQILIREKAKQLFNCNVVLMGSGADEVLDNYRTKGMSEFEIWPDDLSTIFPWTHFYLGSGRRLIDYHETLCLAYGLEKRSIFYDKQLAQEWIHIAADLKNQEHKIFLREYLRKRNIYLTDRIVGFQASRLKKYGVVRSPATFKRTQIY
jgi:asparagine synthetase B (glutamine-hydrolysing)